MNLEGNYLTDDFINIIVEDSDSDFLYFINKAESMVGTFQDLIHARDVLDTAISYRKLKILRKHCKTAD